MTDFTNATCDIYSKTLDYSTGEQTEVDNPIYTAIRCQYYSDSSSMGVDTTLYQDNGSIKVIIGPGYTNTIKGSILDITDDALGIIGTYVVESIKSNKMTTGLDSIQLTCKRYG